MHRILKLSTGGLVALGLIGCPHEAFRTAIDNGTNGMIYLEIHFADSSLPLSRGSLEPGNRLNLTQTIEGISYIEYGIGNHNCRMDEKSLVNAAHVEARNLRRVTLRDCVDAGSGLRNTFTRESVSHMSLWCIRCGIQFVAVIGAEQRPRSHNT